MKPIISHGPFEQAVELVRFDSDEALGRAVWRYRKRARIGRYALADRTGFSVTDIVALETGHSPWSSSSARTLITALLEWEPIPQTMARILAAHAVLWDELHAQRPHGQIVAGWHAFMLAALAEHKLAEARVALSEEQK